MIKILNYFILCAVSLSITFCSKNDYQEQDIKNDYQKQDIFYEGSYPNNFVCYDKEYVVANNESSYSGNFEQIGWLINNKDLDKWKDIDKDENIVYAVSMENAVERYSVDENLKDRWQLFGKKSNKYILKVNTSIYIEKA